MWQLTPVSLKHFGCQYKFVFSPDFPSTNYKVLDDRIIILRAEQRDTAVYQCVVSNKHGTLLVNTNVLVMSEYFTYLCKLEEDEYQTVIFRAQY